MIWVILAGIAIGVVIGAVLLLVVVARLDEDDVLALDQYAEEYEPQRDERLDLILDDIRVHRDGDPRQTARDSATSARSKVFRG